MRLFVAALAITSVAVAGLVIPAGASRLEKEACDQLKTEQTQLGPKKLRDALEKGPEWAKANLTSGELETMRRYIELEEQMLFRCPQPKPPKSLAKLPPPNEDGDVDEQPVPVKKGAAKKPAADKSDGKGEGTNEAAAPVVQPKPKPKPKPKAAETSEPKAKSADAPQAKSKADDALRPKPKDPFVPPPKPEATN